MLGLILNVWDDALPADSPWRTREEVRYQPAVFVLPDGCPVWEVWFWQMGRWWCMSKSFDVNLAAQGVIFFDTKEQLAAKIRELGGVPRAA